MKISVVTLARNRQAAILNLIKGLERCIFLPDELVIVHMNEAVYGHHSALFTIRETEHPSKHRLPLAEARNAAVKLARNEHVIFLDADCIPSVGLIKIYASAFADNHCLWSGRVRYLSKLAMESRLLISNLMELSNPDPVRAGIQSFSYEQFWSLNFGCSKRVFDTIGGFDEKFIGYGGEDTDFSFTARQKGIVLKTIDAYAFHQYHPSYNPPLNHLSDIIQNATRFKEKWGRFPMEGWLRKFSEMGYITIGEDEIKIDRNPSATEIDSCLKSV